MKTARELFDQLNAQDESTEIEAKGASEIGRTVLESVCAFANEPELGGGYILIGADRDDSKLFPYYTSQHISDPDKLQSDLATQCNTMFNIPIRPRMVLEEVNGAQVLVVFVEEVSSGQKPVYFKNESLPKAAYRRIGSTDHRCSEDDLRLFYADTDSYDRTILKRTTLDDLDEDALNQYRKLRSKVNEAAEELTYENVDLLLSLGCLDIESKKHFTLAGLLLFGKGAAQRRELPMLRADYIRVPGTKWVEDPNDRFRTIDMRGSLISLMFRLVEAVNSDLPKGFMLGDGGLQADSIGLPTKALREAIVNALMHRNYRENSPVQVIRYDNRLEIRNPGYSLKSEDQFGLPGSNTRNPVIAAVFHETNLAETKGSGIRAMRRLLQEAQLAPPTFESDREANSFATRLLLHHFLSKDDFEWLNRFSKFQLNDNQKRGLIMLRELEAIDNLSYRQIANVDTLRASNELRQLRDFGIIEPKGKGRATYYILKSGVTTEPEITNTEPGIVNTEPPDLNTEPIAPITEAQTTRENLFNSLTPRVQGLISDLSAREKDKVKVEGVIEELCAIRPMKLQELAALLERQENYLSRTYIKPLLDSGKLNYLHPEMINHPHQAYKTKG